MSFQEKFRTGCFLAVVPLSLVFMFETPINYTMITKSIPDHSIIIITGCLILFSIPVLLNWRWLVDRERILSVLGMFVLGAFIISARSVEFYNAIYQQRLFANSSSYTRTVNIDGVSHVGHRGGDDYFAIVNPNKIPNFEQRMYIQSSRFYLAENAIINGKTKAAENRSDCLIRVMVDKAGSAERIRWDTPPGPSAVVSCGGPAT